MKIIKWVSFPALLAGSMFSRFAGPYEILVNAAICLAAAVVVLRSVWDKEYLCATAFAAIGVIYSPTAMVMKLLLLMGLTCLAAFLNLFAAWRRKPSPVD